MNSLINDRRTEALVILTEECCEVGQIASKIHRWGLEPPTTNRDELIKELGDLLAIISIVQQQFEIPNEEIDLAIAQKITKLKTYSNLLD